MIGILNHDLFPIRRQASEFGLQLMYPGFLKLGCFLGEGGILGPPVLSGRENNERTIT
ncbi:MAG TPA: hypothetical protein VEI01_25280 [Terriglobales bacterium]|nr:hypothetical protein [Terriglobales bacterium]